MPLRDTNNELPGIGLVGVRERVTRLGGRLEVDTRAGKGTRLTIELPITSEPTTGESGSAEATPPIAVTEKT